MILFLALMDKEEDKEKFVRLYEKYRYFLWYLANERLHDAGLAEDAVQEAFFALIRHMEKIGDVDSSATRNFLATIVKSKAVMPGRPALHRFFDRLLSEGLCAPGRRVFPPLPFCLQ